MQSQISIEVDGKILELDVASFVLVWENNIVKVLIDTNPAPKQEDQPTLNKPIEGINNVELQKDMYELLMVTSNFRRTQGVSIDGGASENITISSEIYNIVDGMTPIQDAVLDLVQEENILFDSGAVFIAEIGHPTLKFKDEDSPEFTLEETLSIIKPS